MIRAFVGLGSNLGAGLPTPADRIAAAFADLGAIPMTRLVARSALYASPPLGPIAQPDFVNAAALLETQLSARALLEELRLIERKHGRERHGPRWGPRSLDLDILVYGQAVLDEPDLHVPHRGLPERDFVLYPLRDLDPDLVVPGLGPLAELIAKRPAHGLRKL
jgi:2-amino-4-hydroxy-6-hydroxymethyldihydropteridine diphosphokinase